jgi:hypothetical protein
MSGKMPQLRPGWLDATHAVQYDENPAAVGVQGSERRHGG